MPASSIVSWRVLGGRRTRSRTGPDEDWFDGVDVAVDLDDGTTRALGFRTADLVLAGAEACNAAWDGGYVPIPVDLDLAQVRHWDFNEVLWLGPAEHPCVVWTNAEALSPRGVQTVLTLGRVDALLRGPGGRGLPRLDDLAPRWRPPDRG